MAVAELEAGMISARTKAALAASKARGNKLSGFRERAGSRAGTAVRLQIWCCWARWMTWLLTPRSPPSFLILSCLVVAVWRGWAISVAASWPRLAPGKMVARWRKSRAAQQRSTLCLRGILVIALKFEFARSLLQRPSEGISIDIARFVKEASRFSLCPSTHSCVCQRRPTWPTVQ